MRVKSEHVPKSAPCSCEQSLAEAVSGDSSQLVTAARDAQGLTEYPGETPRGESHEAEQLATTKRRVVEASVNGSRCVPIHLIYLVLDTTQQQSMIQEKIKRAFKSTEWHERARSNNFLA